MSYVPAGQPGWLPKPRQVETLCRCGNRTIVQVNHRGRPLDEPVCSYCVRKTERRGRLLAGVLFLLLAGVLFGIAAWALFS